jgi:hypothetical protein
VEAALAIASMVTVLILCAAGLTAVAMHIRCLDAAREAARLAARGDTAAVAGAGNVAPAGAAVEVRRDGDYFVARVSGRSPVLPGIVIVGEAVSAAEPGR